jgi:hypothetical protein
MEQKKSMFSPLVTVGVLCVFLGGIGGYAARYYGAVGAAPTSATTGGGGGRGGGGGMMGMMGGFGGGQSGPQNGANLARLVRNLSLIEKVQNKGLNADQAKALSPILKEIKGADKLADKDSEAKIAQIQQILTEPQKSALQDLQPPGRGGGGGGGMMGGMGGPPGSSGRPGGGAPGSGGPGGGGRPDPEKPFASERNQQALNDLMAACAK